MEKDFFRTDYENLNGGELFNIYTASNGKKIRGYAGKHTAHVIAQANKRASEICLEKARVLVGKGHE